MRMYYLLATGILSLILALIATFGTGVIRTHGGDVLVVVWLYLLVRTVTMMPKGLAAILVLAIAFAVEFGQVIDIAGQLGIADTAFARLAFGRTFDAFDFLAYGAGAAIAYFADLSFGKKS